MSKLRCSGLLHNGWQKKTAHLLFPSLSVPAPSQSLPVEYYVLSGSVCKAPCRNLIQNDKVLVQKERKITQGCNIDGALKAACCPNTAVRGRTKGFSNAFNAWAFHLPRSVINFAVLSCLGYLSSAFSSMAEVKLLQDIGFVFSLQIPVHALPGQCLTFTSRYSNQALHLCSPGQGSEGQVTDDDSLRRWSCKNLSPSAPKAWRLRGASCS